MVGGLVLLAPQLIDVERLLWTPKRLWTGAEFGPSSYSVASLAELYRKTNTEIGQALMLFTAEAEWFREYPMWNPIPATRPTGLENRIPIIRSLA